MRKLIITTAMLVVVVAVSPALARGGHGHSSPGHSMHRHSLRALSAPANPSVPSSLTPDARLTGSAPLPSGRQLKKADTSSPETRDPEDVKLDQKIKSICRGC